MTLHIVDVSKYQVERPNPLDLAQAKAAGFEGVNIQLDRGRATDVLSDWARTYTDRARQLGMQISTYRWLDNRLPGAESAKRAYQRMQALGGPNGMAHAVDVEDNASEQQVRDYIAMMTGLLGRPIALYTGDWWWQARGWRMADIAPYLWAAPNSGYPGYYPGDDSPMWTAGYAGWSALTAMQYAVKPLPGTGDCSLTAVRDLAAWRVLTEGSAVGAYEEWVAAGEPCTGTAIPLARIGARLRSQGYTVYYIGNREHLKHIPPEDHTPFSATGWPITSPRWWIHAMDIMPPAAGSGLPSLQQLGAQMLSDAKNGKPEMKWLKYMNWEPTGDNTGSCYQERFMPSYEQRSSSDRGHIHLSARSDVCHSTMADAYDPVALIRQPVPPPSSDTRGKDNVTTLYVRTDPNVLWALAGDSPGTTANWLETEDDGLAVAWAETHGSNVHLSAGSWDNFQQRYLEPVNVVVAGPDDDPPELHPVATAA